MSPPRTANSRGSAASTRQSSTGHAPDSAVRHGAGPLIRQSGTGRAPLLLASVRAAIASLQSVSVERTVHVACVCYAGAMGPHAAVRSEVCVAWCARPHALWLHICRTRAHENSEGEGVRCQSLHRVPAVPVGTGGPRGGGIRFILLACRNSVIRYNVDLTWTILYDYSRHTAVYC